jgi:serine/threonine protein kinase
MPAPATTDDFLQLARHSGILETKDLDDYLSSRAESMPGTPAELADAMVRDGLLTGFQAKQFLKGKWRGFLIAGKYKLLEHLGSGGMANVFLCEHVSMRRRVALKLLPAAQAKDPGAVERFYREARAVATLDHPNIVRAHDIDHDGSLHFLVMEYVDGSSLQDIVRKKGPLSVERAAHYISQAAVGLDAAQHAGLVHRDIKPGNILVDRSGAVKVLDMGLARFFHDEGDDITKKFDENCVLGTADYCAPEQALNSHAVDIRVDIYSLGATFYFLLTGRTPFGQGTTAQKIIWHQMKDPTPVRELRPEVPEKMAAVIARMMAKSVDERYQAPAEVYEALTPWTKSEIAPPAEDEMPKLCPRSKGPGSGDASGVRRSTAPTAIQMRAADGQPASGALESTVITPRPGPRGTKTRRAVKPDAVESGAGPTKAGPPPWLVPAAVGGGALLLVVFVALGLWWALSGRGKPVAAGPPPPEVGPSPATVKEPAKGPQQPAENVAVRAEGVTINAEKAGRHVVAPKYEAVVENDGCVTSLKVAGVELLRPGVSFSRGSYFHQADKNFGLPMPRVEQPADNVVTASGDWSSARYEFGADGMTWTVTNGTDKQMNFYLVFTTAVKAVTNGAETVNTPVVKEWPTTTWDFGKAARLKIMGGTRIWGPWPSPRENSQVWHADLAPRETRKVTFQVIGTTDAAAGVSLQSPRDYQVFQRRTRREGAVAVSGRAPPGCDAVEARLTGTSLDGPLPDDWRTVYMAEDRRGFSGTLPTKAGGWYKLEVRALRDKKVVAEGAVDHVGVGEVFVLSGQSNSCNSGEERLKTASHMVSSFGGYGWQPADDPQPGVQDGSNGGSPWPVFGDLLYEKYKVPIGLASTGRGGTSAGEWKPDSELFRGLTRRLDALGPNGCRAILWHQGEADFGSPADTYARQMTEIIRASQKAAGWDVPWFVAQVSYLNPGSPKSDSTRAGQKKLWETKVALEGPDTDALAGDNRDQGGKGIHFSGKGLRAHGKLWADKVSAYLDKALAE